MIGVTKSPSPHYTPAARLILLNTDTEHKYIYMYSIPYIYIEYKSPPDIHIHITHV